MQARIIVTGLIKAIVITRVVNLPVSASKMAFEFNGLNANSLLCCNCFKVVNYNNYYYYHYSL